jgi:HK97 family phage prohead protease
MSSIETRLGPVLALRAAADEQGIIEGLGSTFNGPVDSYGDLIAPGAFAASIAEHRAAGTLPAMLWSHDQSQPIGRWLSVSEDDRGLRLKGKLTLDVPKAREALALAKDQALGLSIGFRLRQADRTPEGHRLIKAVDLWEVSLVAMPSNSAARITSVKAASGFDPNEIRDPRAFEQMLDLPLP